MLWGCYAMAVVTTSDGAVMTVIAEDPQGVNPRILVQHDLTSILMPLVGGETFRNGVSVRDPKNGELLADFVPHCEEFDASWPDWRFVLEARGYALLVKGQRPLGPPEAFLSSEVVATPPDGYKGGWINPLAIAFGNEVPVSGFNGNGGGLIAIGSAIKNAPVRSLIPDLDLDGARRFVAWRAIWGSGGRPVPAAPSRSTPSVLAALLERAPSNGAPFSQGFAELAALDALGGVFIAGRSPSGEAVEWRWRPVEELGVPDSQLADYLADQLDLSTAADEDTDGVLPTTWSWRHPDGWTRPDMVRLDTAPGNGNENRGTRHCLEALANAAGSAEPDGPARDLGPDWPTVRVVAGMLLEAFRGTPPAAAEAIFGPLKSAFVTRQEELWVDGKALLRVFVRQFFTPRSRVLVRMADTECDDRIDSTEFTKVYGHQAIDLFRSPGGEAETLRVVMDTRTVDARGNGTVHVPSETAHDSHWWVAFWRHCTAGHAGERFRLMGRGRAFRLDVSRLDEAPLG